MSITSEGFFIRKLHSTLLACKFVLRICRIPGLRTRASVNKYLWYPFIFKTYGITDASSIASGHNTCVTNTFSFTNSQCWGTEYWIFYALDATWWLIHRGRSDVLDGDSIQLESTHCGWQVYGIPCFNLNRNDNGQKIKQSNRKVGQWFLQLH